MGDPICRNLGQGTSVGGRQRKLQVQWLLFQYTHILPSCVNRKGRHERMQEISQPLPQPLLILKAAEENLHTLDAALWVSLCLIFSFRPAREPAVSAESAVSAVQEAVDRLDRRQFRHRSALHRAFAFADLIIQMPCASSASIQIAIQLQALIQIIDPQREHPLLGRRQRALGGQQLLRKCRRTIRSGSRLLELDSWNARRSRRLLECASRELSIVM